jgi:membrane fusion protein
MSTSLFRREVVDARRQEWLGTVHLNAPRIGWYFFLASVFSIAVILLILSFGHYNRHEQVTGTLVPSSGLLTLMPAVPGVVTRLLAHEGDRVVRGQPLIEISGASNSVSLGNTQTAIDSQLRVKQSRLAADIDGQVRLLEMRTEDMRARLTNFGGQISETEQQIALQKKRSESAFAVYEQWQKQAARGIVSKVQVLQQHDLALQSSAQLSELRSRLLELRQQSEQLRSEMEQLPASVAASRNETERQLADVARGMAENAAQSALQLRAEVSGTVASVMVHDGQAVVPQQSLMTVLPDGASLRGELWVPSRSIGFVHAGQPVVIRYRAYPYQKFGQHIGRVDTVSRSALLPAEVNRMAGSAFTEPQYRVEVTLDGQQISAYDKQEALMPGMAVDADIVLDRRRLIEWVLEPLYGIKRQFEADAAVNQERQG